MKEKINFYSKKVDVIPAYKVGGITTAGVIGVIATLCEQEMIPLCEIRERANSGGTINDEDMKRAEEIQPRIQFFRELLEHFGQHHLVMEAEEQARQTVIDRNGISSL